MQPSRPEEVSPEIFSEESFPFSFSFSFSFPFSLSFSLLFEFFLGCSTEGLGWWYGDGMYTGGTGAGWYA